MLDFAQVAILSAGAVTIIQQVLKLRIVPIAFANRYPVPTNVILSVLAAVYVKWQDIVNLHSFGDWAAFVGVVAVVAAVTYNQLLGRSTELKSMEGERKWDL